MMVGRGLVNRCAALFALLLAIALPGMARAEDGYALWLRYAVGLLSLLAGGLGFWWAWIDRDGRAWHDRASGTRLVRVPKA